MLTDHTYIYTSSPTHNYKHQFQPTPSCPSQNILNRSAENCKATSQLMVCVIQIQMLLQLYLHLVVQLTFRHNLVAFLVHC